MKAVIVLITAVLIAAWGCGKISSSVEAQNPPQFSGTFAFGNGPLVGATTATNGSLTGNMVFAGSCLAQITGTYQETGPTAFGQLTATPLTATPPATTTRSEEHTSELQSRLHLVCRLLLEKKKNNHLPTGHHTQDTLH